MPLKAKIAYCNVLGYDAFSELSKIICFVISANRKDVGSSPTVERVLFCKFRFLRVSCCSTDPKHMKSSMTYIRNYRFKEIKTILYKMAVHKTVVSMIAY